MKRVCLVMALVSMLMVSCNPKDDDNNTGVNGKDVPTGKICGYEYVDLGLSVKWATCNVGADSPEDYGNYYAWGETCTKHSYDGDNCSTYGVQLGNISGNPEYDVARYYWGGTWRMPTEGEMRELIDDCTWTRMTQNGIEGYKVTGPNGNSIFLPAAGFRYGSSLDDSGSRGYYWSSTPCDYNLDCSAYYLFFTSDFQYMSSYYRNLGLSVRPVVE